MQFTEIGELNKLIRHSRNNKMLLFQNRKKKDSQSRKDKILLGESSANIQSIMRDIDGYAKSLISNIQQPEQEAEEIRPKARTQYVMKRQYEHQPIEQLTFKKFEKFDKLGGGLNVSSNIFHKKFKKNIVHQEQKKIQVFYFGMPISKLIPYDENTLVQNLIERAIFAYLEDNQLDKSKIKTINKEGYTLRFQDDDDSCKPDLEAEPLNSNSKVNELSQQCFILIANLKQDRSPENQKWDKQILEIKKTIKFFDQNGQQITTSSFENNHLTQDIYQFLQNQCKQIKPFYLTESMGSSFELAKNIFINQLETQKVYVKRKIFADQPTIIKPPPLQIDKDKLNNEDHEDIAPLSLTQASTYQQFKVIKISEKGNRKPKILGIDQNKIYHFDTVANNSEKSTNFIEKILGLNLSFGTKNSEFFIKDIVSLNSDAEKNQIYIKLNASKKKKLETYEVQKSVRVVIMKKLQFLFNYMKVNEQNRRS